MNWSASVLRSSFFQQSLQDLVKGLRSNRRTEAAFIQEKLVSLADEARSSDSTVKSTALLKLTYLQMLGQSIGFAAFPIIETISNPSFPIKRIGYLAAAQSFSPSTDVLLLATNQFKKDLTNGRLQDCSQALTCLAKLVNEQLGRDVEHDLEMLLKSPRPYIRKKALLVLYRLILVHEDTLPIVGPRLRELLSDDPDPSVVCAAVTVVCELAQKSPSSFLPLAPILYGLLTNSTNNWMLIKIVSLFGVLTPVEPRLAKKLLPHLVQLMRTTRAKSLLYECCSTVTLGMTAHQEAVDLCAVRLGEFLVDDDQNLKYLGLVAMARLINAHREAAIEHRDLILDCLDDEDISIRMKALDLVSELVSKRSLRDLCTILLRKLQAASNLGTASISALDTEAPYRTALAERLLAPGAFTSGIGYSALETEEDFQWYMREILGGLAKLRSLTSATSEKVAHQLVEIVGRVDEAREAGVEVSIELLRLGANEEDSWGLPECVITSAAWIVGEHGRRLKDKTSVIDLMLQARFDRIQPDPQIRLIMAAVKLLGKFAEAEDPDQAINRIKSSLSRLCSSERLAVQERAWLLSCLVSCDPGTLLRSLSLIFKETLRPVDDQAQRNVEVPKGLDLDIPLGVVDVDKTIVDAGPEEFENEAFLFQELEGRKNDLFGKKDSNEESNEESNILLKEYGISAQQDRRRDDPFYLGAADDGQDVQKTRRPRGSHESLTFSSQFQEQAPSGKKVKVFVGDMTIPDDLKKNGTKEREATSKSGVAQPNMFDGLFDGDNVDKSGRFRKKKRKRRKKKREREAEANLIEL